MNTDLQRRPAAAQTEARKIVIAFNIEIAGLVMIPPALELMETMFKADMIRALEEQNLLIVGEPDPANEFKPRCTQAVLVGPNWIYGLFFVSDLSKGLLTVEAELKRTGLFSQAEIGFHCPHELFWRRYHPKTDASPFKVRLFEKLEDRIVNSKLLATILWFASASTIPPKP